MKSLILESNHHFFVTIQELLTFQMVCLGLELKGKNLKTKQNKSAKKLAIYLLLLQTVGIRSICIYVHFSNQIKQTWDRIQTSCNPTDFSTSEDYRH